MRQHVFAFLVALVVWVSGSTIINVTLPEASARSTSMVEGRCEFEYVPIDWWQQGCQILDTECMGSCTGLARLDNRCKPVTGTGWVCRDYDATVPVYYFEAPCRWMDTPLGRGCQCDVNGPNVFRYPMELQTLGKWCTEGELA